MVGRKDPTTGEPVMVILKSNAYLICTPNRGFARGNPVMVGLDQAIEVEHFEENETKAENHKEEG